MSSTATAAISYPRRRFIRHLLRFIFCNLVRILFRLEIIGAENWPKHGRLLVVGNHAAYLEAGLMAAFTPRLLEILTATDVPPAPARDWLVDLYGYIPITRGTADRQALSTALEVLKQDQWVGIFPEGGVWSLNKRSAHSGVAWLSAKAQAPIIPVGFGGMVGAIRSALRLQRPTITIHVGKVIPPVQAKGRDRRAQLQDAADEVMATIYSLLPAAEREEMERVTHEAFTCGVQVQAASGETLIDNALTDPALSSALGHLIFVPVILNTIDYNFKKPIPGLLTYNRPVAAATMQQNCEVVLAHLRDVDPTYLTFRFGQEGAEMAAALTVIRDIARENPQAMLTLLPQRTYQQKNDPQVYIDTDPPPPHV